MRDTSGDRYVVETTRLTKRFGSKTVVDGVDLQVPGGVAFGYLGPNGAGKTTLIRMLLGLVEPSSGSMRLLGRPLPSERAQALARVGAIVDEPRFHAHMTGRQNLSILAAARDPAAHARIDSALERVGLAARAHDRVASYSMGMRQRLGIAACLLADPELLILDEPMNGLDPAGMLEFRGLIRELVNEGRTVVLSSHLLDEVERTCDQVAIVDQGRVVVQASLDELRRSASQALHVATGDNRGALPLLSRAPGVARVDERGDELALSLRRDASPNAAAAAVARRLIAADIDLYRICVARASLEQRFLEITSRLGVAS